MHTLSLFNCVIASTEPQEARYNIKHGIVMGPNASYAYDQIVRWYDYNSPTGEDLNKSFFKSWNDALSVDIEERLIIQLTHYFTTYGLESLGLKVKDVFTYTPALKDGHAAPSHVKFKVVKAAGKQEIINRCFSLLNKGALKTETIESIFGALWECDYKLTGEERVANREAQSLIYKKTGTMPTKGSELFRYLINDATNETLVIKNPKLIEMIKASGYGLMLNKEQRRELAKSFNRYKPLWLAFKKAHVGNVCVVNEISRLSKSLHEPLSKDYLGTVTSQYHLYDDLEAAASTAPLPVVLRAMNACKAYMEDNTSRAYRIRNGKVHTKEKERSIEPGVIAANLSCLKGVVKSRIGDYKVYMPAHISYTMPTSEKNFVGNYPTGTVVSIPKGEEQLLIGVYWEDQKERVDIDLSGVSVGAKVGWNSSWGENNLNYSGDVTSAPKGAAEWLYASEITSSYLIQANLFSGPSENCKFKLIVGYGSRPDKNYMIDPNKVIFSADMQFEDGAHQIVLGVLRPTDSGAEFILSNGSIGSNRVSSDSGKEGCARAAYLTALPKMVKVSEIFTVVDSPAKADIDLSTEGLTRDSLLQLLG